MGGGIGYTPPLLTKRMTMVMDWDAGYKDHTPSLLEYRTIIDMVMLDVLMKTKRDTRRDAWLPPCLWW